MDTKEQNPSFTNNTPEQVANNNYSKTHENLLNTFLEKHNYSANCQNNHAQDINELEDGGAHHLTEIEKVFHLLPPGIIFTPDILRANWLVIC